MIQKQVLTAALSVRVDQRDLATLVLFMDSTATVPETYSALIRTSLELLVLKITSSTGLERVKSTAEAAQILEQHGFGKPFRDSRGKSAFLKALQEEQPPEVIDIAAQDALFKELQDGE